MLQIIYHNVRISMLESTYLVYLLSDQINQGTAD